MIQSASATVAGSTRHVNQESVPPAAVRACPQQRTLGGSGTGHPFKPHDPNARPGADATTSEPAPKA